MVERYITDNERDLFVNCHPHRCTDNAINAVRTTVTEWFTIKVCKESITVAYRHAITEKEYFIIFYLTEDTIDGTTLIRYNLRMLMNLICNEVIQRLPVFKPFSVINRLLLCQLSEEIISSHLDKEVRHFRESIRCRA